MTEFMKHVFPMFFRPLSPSCLTPTTTGDDSSPPNDSLFLRLFRDVEGDVVEEETPPSAPLPILGELETS